MDGLTEEQFLHLLGEPAEAIRDRFLGPPPWLKKLAQAFSRPTSSEPISLPEGLRGQEAARFLVAIEPLMHQGRDRVLEGIQTLVRARSNLPFDPHTVEEILFANLPARLMMMISRTMVLELHVARLQGLLEGDTPEERFQSFLKRIRQRDIALAILREYPVLARQLINV